MFRCVYRICTIVTYCEFVLEDFDSRELWAPHEEKGLPNRLSDRPLRQIRECAWTPEEFAGLRAAR